MIFFEFHEGCHGIDSCVGPLNDYYTLFDSKLNNLNKHMVTALVLGLLVGAILSAMKRKNNIRLPTFAIILIQLISTIIFFFLLAYFFPKV